MNRLLGIFGGSFNPIHTGHLLLAEYIREEFILDRVIFIPAGNPPHKKVMDLETAHHRYNMVKLAIEDNPFFDVSDIEFKREGISYTCDTLSEIKNEYPSGKLFFVCGSDSIVQFVSWREIGRIFELADIIVARRTNVSEKELEYTINEYRKSYNARITCSSAPYLEISSTDIRNRIKKGLSIRYMVPSKVSGYIESNGLYRGE